MLLKQYNFKLTDDEKRALRSIAAEESFPDVQAYIRHVLYTCTPLAAKIASFPLRPASHVEEMDIDPEDTKPLEPSFHN